MSPLLWHRQHSFPFHQRLKTVSLVTEQSCPAGTQPSPRAASPQGHLVPGLPPSCAVWQLSCLHWTKFPSSLHPKLAFNWSWGPLADTAKKMLQNSGYEYGFYGWANLVLNQALPLISSVVLGKSLYHSGLLIPDSSSLRWGSRSSPTGGARLRWAAGYWVPMSRDAPVTAVGLSTLWQHGPALPRASPLTKQIQLLNLFDGHNHEGGGEDRDSCLTDKKIRMNAIANL